MTDTSNCRHQELTTAAQLAALWCCGCLQGLCVMQDGLPLLLYCCLAVVLLLASGYGKSERLQ